MMKKLLVITMLTFALISGLSSTSIASDAETIQARDKGEMT